MDLRILEKNIDSIHLMVNGIDTSFANTIRRIILAEVPSMAIDDVVVIENSSVLHDEIIALRLGLIPLKTDLDAYNYPEECTCNSELGCNLCRTVLTLDVEAGKEVKTVYSADLASEDPNISPVSNRIPIVKLAPGQKLRLEAYAKLGKGVTHAKWQPVSSCIYRYMPKVQIDLAYCDSCGDCVNVCPKNVFEKKDKEVRVVKEIECILCDDCVEVCSKEPPAVQIQGDESSFLFFIESTGVLSVERIIKEAFKIYDSKCSKFIKKLKVQENEYKKKV